LQPLRQRISLQKKKSKERSKEEGDNAFAIPSRVTVRREEVEQEDEEAAARRLASSTNVGIIIIVIYSFLTAS
jgi:hypothetical protein